MTETETRFLRKETEIHGEHFTSALILTKPTITKHSTQHLSSIRTRYRKQTDSLMGYQKVLIKTIQFTFFINKGTMRSGCCSYIARSTLCGGRVARNEITSFFSSHLLFHHFSIRESTMEKQI